MRDIVDYEVKYQTEPCEIYQVKYRRKKVLELLEKYKHRKILEIGCGMEPLKMEGIEFDYIVLSSLLHEVVDRKNC